MTIRQKPWAAKLASGKDGSILSEPDKLLHESARNDDTESLREALSAGANPESRDEYDRSPLHRAAGNGHFECASLLLPVSDLAARDIWGWTPLHWAAQNGHHECVSLLLPLSDPRASDKDGFRPIDLAAGSGHLECLSLLLPLSDPDVRRTALYWASTHIYPKCVSLIEAFSLDLESAAKPPLGGRWGGRL